MSKRKIKKRKPKIIIDGVHNPKLSVLEKEIVDEIVKQAPEFYVKAKDPFIRPPDDVECPNKMNCQEEREK